METKHCLNCSEVVDKRFCPNCGQKTDIHRMTFKHFIFHDILHGVWHMERGILFTVKEVLTRPGKSAIDYISGKRIKYYNFFYLTVIIVGLLIFLSDYYDELNIKYNGITTDLSPGQMKVSKLYDKYSKIFFLGLIPFFAFFSYFIYRRPKFNLSEHLIIGGICFLGILILANIEIILSYFSFTTHLEWISTAGHYVIPTYILLYVFNCYYTAFSSHYSKKAILWRTLLFVIVLPLFFLGLFILIITLLKQFYV